MKGIRQTGAELIAFPSKPVTVMPVRLAHHSVFRIYRYPRISRI
jgi:hypothetical protein